MSLDESNLLYTSSFAIGYQTSTFEFDLKVFECFMLSLLGQISQSIHLWFKASHKNSFGVMCYILTMINKSNIVFLLFFVFKDELMEELK